MKLTFFAGRLPHFAEHSAPIWHALPPEYRGSFHALGRAAKRATELGIDPIVQKVPRNAEMVIVASFEDYRAVSPSPVILVNHGAGQTYKDGKGIDHPSYSGGSNRERVVLFLGPSERDAEVSRLAYPGARSVAVGVPKLDPFHLRKRDCEASFVQRSVPPVVAFTFHCDTHVVPETRWAWPFFKNAITDLARRQSELPFKLLGHCHPRFYNYMEKAWRALKVEFEPDSMKVLERADCLVWDNTSFGYEFSSLDKPSVVLSPPWYRRDVEHNLRFWSHIPGVECDDPANLKAAILLALGDPPNLQKRRREVVKDVYSGIALDGRATERAVSAIVELLDGS